MFKSLLFFFILSIFSIKNYGQEKVKTFVKQNVISISTVEPDSANFSDLEGIGNAIGDSKIVMLGEQDHGDAPTFLAKTRLIKYLHEKKGFNILAFESDFFGLNYGWENLNKQKIQIDTFIRKNIFPIWTNCNTCGNLFYNYIPSTYQTANPIIVTGFDNQMILNYSAKNLKLKLDSVFKSLDLPIVKNTNYSSAILPMIDSLRFGYFDKLSPSFYSNCDSYLKEIRKQAEKKLTEDSFWLLIINNLIQENIEYKTLKTDHIQSSNARDYQMAQNLRWLTTTKFPKEKIIVWAANAHVGKYVGNPKNEKVKQIIAMGSYFTRDSSIMKDTYVLGFTSYKGTAGRLGFKTYSIDNPKQNSFENWIDQQYNYAFVDFKTYNKKFPSQLDKFYLKGLGHYSFFKYDWTKVFDGVFYIKEMYPCKR